MALHWPVMENGAAPARPMLPVMRHRSLSSVTVSVPWTEWLTPMVQATKPRSARPKAGRGLAEQRRTAMPHSAAAAATSTVARCATQLG